MPPPLSLQASTPRKFPNENNSNSNDTTAKISIGMPSKLLALSLYYKISIKKHALKTTKSYKSPSGSLGTNAPS